MRLLYAGVLTFLCLVTARLIGEDLKSLLADYRQAKASVKGAPKDRAARVASAVVPVLTKIGKVDTDESLNFLLREIDETDGSMPEIAAACVAPALASSKPTALNMLVKGLAKRSRVYAKGLFDALAATKKDLSPIGAELLQAAQTNQDAELKKVLPPVLGKLDTLPAAKVLIAQVQAPKGGKTDDSGYGASVVAALKGTKNEEIKKWLGKGAFDAAASDVSRLSVVVKVVGELKLAESRGELEKLTSHPSPDVSAAAVQALSQLGIGESSESMVAALEKRKGKGDLAVRVQALDALAKTGTDSALQTVLRYAKGKDPEMKAVAMGSLIFFKDNPQAQAALIAGLQDPDPSIRAVTFRAISQLREKFVIHPLIDLMAKEKDESLKIKVLQQLVKLTDKNMGLVAEDWKKWWEIAEAQFEFPKEGEKGFTSVKAYDLSYFGIEVSSKRLGFLVDVSSSMLETVAVRSAAEKAKEGGDPDGKTAVGKGKDGDGQLKTKGGKARKIDILKRELVKVIKKLSADAQINIVTFHTTFDAWQKELQPLAGNGRVRAIQFVEGLKNGVGTNVFDTLEFALKDRRVNTIYLLTDGLPTRGRLVDPKAILQEIGAQNRLRGVTIHCIAFGEESSLLKDLAAQNGGEYRFVDRY